MALFLRDLDPLAALVAGLGCSSPPQDRAQAGHRADNGRLDGYDRNDEGNHLVAERLVVALAVSSTPPTPPTNSEVAI